MHVVEQIPETKIRMESGASKIVRISLSVILLTAAALYVLVLIKFTTDVMVLRPGIYTTACRLFMRTRNVAILIFIIYVGLNLLSTRKHSVLFLRRFGLDVNSVVSRVIQKGLGRRFRFVTLDDGKFPAVDVPALERWTGRLGPPVIAALVVFGALAARQSLSQLHSSNGAYAQTAAQMSAVMGYWIAIFWALLMLAWIHLRRVRRKSRYDIRRGGKLTSFLLDIRTLDSWRLRLSFLGPEAVVAKVSDSLWQKCVSDVSELLGMVLIDVSDPTPNLQWEIERSRGQALRCVFIAERSRLQSWIASTHDPAAAAAGHAVAKLIGEDRVLVYEGDQKLGGASFRRSLQQLLREACREMPQRNPGKRLPLVDGLWRFSLAVIFHAFVLFVALASGALLGMLVFYGTAAD
jgi:hypothetical protein